MTKDELMRKYEKKYDYARLRYHKARRNKHKNQDTNPKEAELDALEQESWSKEFRLCDEFLDDLEKLES